MNAMNGFQAASIGKAVCPTCGLLGSPAADRACRRCGTALHFRKPGSIERSWALLLAAYALYLPANLLPIMETRSLFGSQQDTIMSGVVLPLEQRLLGAGPGRLHRQRRRAAAQTAVPDGAAGRHSAPRAPAAAAKNQAVSLSRTDRPWSMLDVYVVTILVALVQVQSLATIRPGVGVLAFAAVVVLSMLATMAFEPRLIWDAVDNPIKSSAGPSQGRTRPPGAARAVFPSRGHS